MSNFIQEYHRLNDSVLLTLLPHNNAVKFAVTHGQYVPQNIDDIVWGSTTPYKHRLNKLFNQYLYEIPQGEFNPLPALLCRLYFSNYDTNSMGYLFVVYDLVSKTCLNSSIIRQENISFNTNTQTQYLTDSNGFKQYFPYTVSLHIPQLSHSTNLAAYIAPIQYKDVSKDNENLGEIYTYPNLNELIPIINNNLVQNTIETKVIWETNQYLTISLHTTENKTIEQSILDMFNLKTASITVEHEVHWGNDAIGWKTLSISNRENKYGSISFLPDFRKYVGDSINIIVTTNINVDGKLIQRQVVTNNKAINNIYLFDDIIASTEPLQHNVVSVEEVTRIEQTVINQKESDPKIVTIQLPVPVQVVSQKNIPIDITSPIRYVIFDSNVVRLSKSHKLVLANKKTQEIVTTCSTSELANGEFAFDLDMIILNKTDMELYYSLFDGSQWIMNGDIKK